MLDLDHALFKSKIGEMVIKARKDLDGFLDNKRGELIRWSLWAVFGMWKYLFLL